MEDKSETQYLSEDGETCFRYQMARTYSLHREYTNEGDEFLDDAIRTFDQDFKQMDGTLEVWRLRAAAIDKSLDYSEK